MVRLFLLLPALILAGCQTRFGSDAEQVSLVPRPVLVSPAEGSFMIGQTASARVESSGAELAVAAKFLASYYRNSTSRQLDVNVSDEPGDESFLFSLDDQIKGTDGYRLTITDARVEVRANSPRAAIYAVQTLRQLLPASHENATFEPWVFPQIQIEDYARFRYRGMHLDVGRHFFPLPFIKKYIDLLSLHKFNYFHWHLTEDQGWRIEIKKYPKLTQVGAWRKETRVEKSGVGDGVRYGGFYTQDEVREAVSYALERGITIIPEIEMPGHSLAALASYPELACHDETYEVATRWGVFDQVYCPTDATFAFLQDVLTEVMDLFPGPYVHIGGDECPKGSWKRSSFCQNLMKAEGLEDEHELQSYFIHRIEKMLSARGKTLIGWDEILEGGLSPKATVMSWRGISGGIAAACQDHDVIMTPTSHCYFDYYQGEQGAEPLAIGGHTDVREVYSFDPIPIGLDSAKHRYILGAQANVWTEYMKTPEHVEYMVLPRMAAMAEVLWSPEQGRDWDDFKARMSRLRRRYDALGLNYAPHMFSPADTPPYTSGDFVLAGANFRTHEGPVVDKYHRLLFVNFERQGSIGMVTLDRVGHFVQLPEGSVGNGLRIASSGSVFVADTKGRKVLKYDPLLGETTVHASHPDMVAPNDLAITSGDVLYVSDPDWEEGTGQVFRVDPDGRAEKILPGLGTTNGIEINPDESILYVNESEQRKIWAFDLDASGAASGKRLFASFDAGGLDGMRCDEKGNLYVTRYDLGAVVVLTPAGDLKKTILLKGKKVTNIAFGGIDGKTCYLTFHDRPFLESFRAETAGRSWNLMYARFGLPPR